MREHTEVALYRHYNTNLRQSAIVLEEYVPENHIARLIDTIIEDMDEHLFLSHCKTMGRPRYHPKVMTKIVVYSYAVGIYSGRRMERLLHEHLPLMWLTAFECPDANTINRFRVGPMAGLLEEVFRAVLFLLIDRGEIKIEDYFVDGTKIESRANRYTFTWKRSIHNYQRQIEEKFDTLMTQIFEEDDGRINIPEALNEKLDLGRELIGQRLNEVPKDKELKKAVKKIDGWIERQVRYTKQLAICGEERNSFSKTDPEATFMRMKDDHMRNGQLKPAYNIQMATENQIILFYSIHQRPTDARCLIPHLKEMEEFLSPLGQRPRCIIADAGYGSEENFLSLSELGYAGLIKYTNYEREQKKRYRENVFVTERWPYDEMNDTLTCPAGKTLVRSGTRQQRTASGYIIEQQQYVCHECADCPFIKECLRRRSSERSFEHPRKIVRRSSKWLDLKQNMKADLDSSIGKSVFSKRKVEVESVFGSIKQNWSFRRFRLGGLEGARLEFGLVAIAHNLRKLVKNPLLI